MFMSEAKSFDITKREVWDAYKRVKANRGAAAAGQVISQQKSRDFSDNSALGLLRKGGFFIVNPFDL